MIARFLILAILVLDRAAARLETERRRKAVKAQRRAAVQDLIAELEHTQLGRSAWCPVCLAFLRGGEWFPGRACGTCHGTTVPGHKAKIPHKGREVHGQAVVKARAGQTCQVCQLTHCKPGTYQECARRLPPWCPPGSVPR